MTRRTVLWWGRFDPEYSRNRVLRSLLPDLGWKVVDFHPIFSSSADIEAMLRRLPKPDLVWVPCFRQRDLAAARRWSRARGIPLVFDPLISAYDKQVFEREKLTPNSLAARRLLKQESRLFQLADRIIADTSAHVDFFADTLGVPGEKLSIVYVGAEELLFKLAEPNRKTSAEPLEVLFYGSFIPLHGAEYIAKAARLCSELPVRWRFIGKGPSRARCEEITRGQENVTFEDWVNYADLPRQIWRADVVLGIFGTTQKAGRVIPNKVFQALACGRPVITRKSNAYPGEMISGASGGVFWVEAGSPEGLCDKLLELSMQRQQLTKLAREAHDSYQQYFSGQIISGQLRHCLEKVLLR